MSDSVPQNAAIFLRPLAHYLQRQGLDPKELLQRHGIDPDNLNDPEYRVSSVDTHALLNDALALLDEPAMGISMARHTEYSAFGGLGVALAAGGSVRAVLARITRFHALMSDAIVSRLEDDRDRLTISFARRARHEPHPQAIIFVMASIVRMLRFRIDRQLNPLSVSAPPVSDECRAALKRYFRCDIHAADDFRLTFNADTSGSHLDASDPEMADLLETTLTRRLAAQQDTPLAMRLALWLENRLPEGEPPLQEAASEFHLSQRSLQRKLNDEGVTFQRVIENTRRALVERHLLLPGMTVTQLTFLLGFSDVSSFSRAFRRWYGVSPSDYRRRAGQGPTQS